MEWTTIIVIPQQGGRGGGAFINDAGMDRLPLLEIRVTIAFVKSAAVRACGEQEYVME